MLHSHHYTIIFEPRNIYHNNNCLLTLNNSNYNNYKKYRNGHALIELFKIFKRQYRVRIDKLFMSDVNT